MLIGVVGIGGFVEMLGVASIMPFIAVVSDSSVISSNKYLSHVYTWLNMTNTNTFLFILGIFTLVMLTFGNGYSAFVVWKSLYFSRKTEHSISDRLLTIYIRQPYTFFINNNTSELGKNLLMEVSRFVNGVLHPFVSAIAKFVIIIFMLSLLFVNNPLLTLIVFLILGVCFSFLYTLTKKKLAFVGKAASEMGAKRYKYASESMGAIKDIKLLGREQSFIRHFSIASDKSTSYGATSQIIAQLPRYAIETLAFGSVLLIVLYYIWAHKDIKQVFPVITLYAFAGYRLLPAFQQLFAAISSIRFNMEAVEILARDLSLPERISQDVPNNENLSKEKPVFVNQKIALRNISYTYSGISKKVLDNVSLVIQPNTTIGFVGKTGSGKTTAIDILLGLLTPTEGKIIVGDTEITHDNIRKWQDNIGYVPQNIFLSDDSIARNIAFGLDDIDMEAVKNAAELANIHSFITKELEDGYDTCIGERGIRLSGGQRQRIGIARALYHQPMIIVFDEATSALDSATEKVIMEAINNLAHKRTIIMIAHRVATLKRCDAIYEIHGGRIIEHGAYNDLRAKTEAK